MNLRLKIGADSLEKRQCVSCVGDLGGRGGEDDLDYVDADGDIGVAEEAQPGLCAGDDGLLLGGIDGIGGADEGAGGARFYFDEDEGLFFAADEVDFAAMGGTEVAVEDFEAAAAEVAGGEALAPAAEEEVRGQPGVRRRGRGAAGRPGEKFCDEWGKGHGV